jgi:hypothetical protein
LATGDERSAAIANMESMGFVRADIDRAMRAAFQNPDRAVEYLLNVCFAARCLCECHLIHPRVFPNISNETNEFLLLPLALHPLKTLWRT